MDSWRPQNVVELSEDSDDSSCPSLTDPDAEEDASLSALPLPPGRAIGLVAAASSASGTAAAANGIESHDDDSLPGLDDDEVPALDSDSEGSYEMSDDDEPPPMLDAASDEDSEADDDDESEPPGLDSADEQDTADEPEDEDPPELVTGTDDDEGGSDDDGDDDSEPPSLEDNDSDDEGADYGGLKPGFLGGANKPKRKAKPAESRYSGEGVGRKEAGPSAAARSGSKPSKPSGGVAASVAADFANSTGSYFSTPTPGSFKQHPPPKPQSQQPKQPKAPSSQQQKQWQQSSKRPRAQPAAAAPAAPQQPAEVVVAREGLEAINKEREEARRRLQMQTASSSAALTQPVGRCCLNRGLDGDIRFCEKDKMRALVMPDERRVQMKCSAGCLMAWHQECWRTFQQLHEHETRDPNTGHGINLIQALKVKDKAKDKPLVKCVTDGCNGYINLLGVFEGPLGHETFKNHLFTPTPLVLAAIKEAEAAQKAALVEARAAAKAEKDAASFARWYEKYGPKEPKQPKKPRVKKPKPQQPADGAVGAGAAAASTGAGIVDDDLMSFLSSGKKIEMIASNAAAAAPAAVSQQQPSRPKGIQVKNRVDPKLRVLHVKQQQQQQQEEEEAPRTPSTTALSESTSQAASASLEPTCSRHTSVLDHQSNAEQQLEATSARDHVDPSYHADLTEYMAVHGGAGPQEAKAKGRKEKKKGMRMHLEEFQQVAGQGPSAQAAPSAAPAAPQPPPAAAAAAQPAPPARKQRAPRMGEFPALHEALLGKAEPASAEPDFLAEALMQLKIAADDGRHTAYLLFECVDFFMLRKKEMDAEEAMRDVIQSKSGIAPIMTWVFPQQEAVAVLMPTIDAAVLAFINCRLIPTWGRKQLRVCFLSDAPDDETLHRVYPDYLPPQMAEQKRMEEELRVLQQQAGVDSVEVDSAEREALAALVRDGAITDVQLLEALEKGMTAAQAAAMAAAARKGKEASNAASAPNAGSSSNTSSSTSVKDKKEALVGKAADTSKAAAAAAEATQPAGIPPPRPPPEPPALKSAADAAAKQQQAKAVTAAFKQRQQLQQQQLQQQQVRSSSAMPQTSTAGHVVMQQPAAVYGSMPMMPAMMQPAMIMQPAVPAMYMPVSSGMMPATMTPAVPVQMVPVQQYSWQQQQQHLQQQQWLLQQQQQQQRQQQQRPSYVMQQQPLPPPQQSQQQQQQQQHNTAGARHHDDDGEDEDNWGQLDQEPKQEQERGRSMAAGSNRAISATTASTSSLRNASLSPGSKMNPLAPEFKPAGASQPGPSRLNASTSSAAVAEDVADEAQQAEAATHAAAAAGAISTDSDAASSSKQPADAAPAGAAPSASAAADGGEASGGKADGQSSSSGGGVSGGGDSAGSSSSSTAGTSTPSTAANASKDDQPVDSAAAAIAAAAAAAAASPSGEDRSPAAPDASAAGIDTSESVQPASGSDAGSQQAAAAAPTPAAAAAAAPAAPHGLPPDHVFDAVYLTGCQTEHLSVYRNPTANIKLPVNHFGGEADVAGVSEAAGLIVYNNDAHETEGLWRALHQEGGNIEWQPVAQYWGVPLTVMHQPLLGSGGIKRAYRGAEGLAITKAMWDWSHPQQQQQQTGAQAGASGQQPAPAPGSGPSSTAAAGASSQQPQPTAAAAGGGASTGTQHPARPGPSASSTVAGSSAAGSRPGTAGSTASGHAAAAAAGTDGAGPGPGAAGRALPGVFGLLARRPPSSGGTGAAGSQAAAAAATSSSAAAPAAPAAAAPPPAGPAAAAAPAPAAAPPAVGASSGGGVSGYLRCTLCQQKQPAWVVIQPCKHLGPCKDCLAPVGGERKKTYPPEYPTCLQCNATVVELMRIII